MSTNSPIFDADGAGAPPGAGSDRTFGVFFAVVFALLGGYALWQGRNLGWAAALLAAVLAALAWLAPGALHGANLLWFRLGLLLGRIVNPVVIGAMFFLVVTPIGLLMRAFGKRPLSLTFDNKASTYWIERRPAGPPPESMRDQF